MWFYFLFLFSLLTIQCTYERILRRGAVKKNVCNHLIFIQEEWNENVQRHLWYYDVRYNVGIQFTIHIWSIEQSVTECMVKMNWCLNLYLNSLVGFYNALFIIGHHATLYIMVVWSQSLFINKCLFYSVDLLAIWSEAFLLDAIPAVLLASHQYTPLSCSRLFCITLQK